MAVEFELGRHDNMTFNNFSYLFRFVQDFPSVSPFFCLHYEVDIIIKYIKCIGVTNIFSLNYYRTFIIDRSNSDCNS